MGDSTDSISRRLAGFVSEITQTWRLLRDPHVPVWAKAIPFLSLAYLVWPIDLLADPILGLGQLDDLAIILLAMKAFRVVCALPQVVDEAGAAPQSRVSDDDVDVVDAEYRVIDSQDE